MPERFGVIVAGAGIAGLSAAIAASESRGVSVAVIDRFDGSRSNTNFAQGGIAAAIGKQDSWRRHAHDTLETGCGLCDAEIVNIVTKKGPGAIRGLMALGLVFDGGNERPELGLEGGHSEKRVLHIEGDQTGKEALMFMRKIAEEKGNVYFFGNAALRHISTHAGEYAGAIIMSGKEQYLASGSLVLATGGYAACFEKTTNPETTLGSGIAVAHDSGCALRGMEFVQFHPTTLASKAGGNFLVSEAVRGEGGKIIDAEGRQIVNPLDTRDKVSIAIYSETMKGRQAFLDARGFEPGFFRKRFPSVHAGLMKHGINPETDPIPIEAAAHYTIGGVATDANARTTVKGIFAAGECTNSGLHGANRLASNSLLEGLVLGKIAGKNAALHRPAAAQAMQPPAMEEREGTAAKTALDAMKKIMWRCCGVMRNESGMRDGLAGIISLEKNMEERDTTEPVAMGALLVSRKTIEAALARKESIGTHCLLK